MNGETQALTAWFHTLWDGFPGPVRLIDRDHTILAANAAAVRAGFEPGLCCARVKTANNHRGCLAGKLLKTGEAQTDRTGPGTIRGWVPVEGHEGIFVHYTLALPPWEEES